MKFYTLLTGIILAATAASFCNPAAAQNSASGEVTTKCGNTPKQPNIPNGTKASMDEMLASQQAIKAYQAEAQKYRSCLDGVIAAWDSQGGDSDEVGKKKEIAITFYNRSVSDEEDVANLFNTAIRAFKGKQQ